MRFDRSSLTPDRGVSLVEFIKILQSDWAATIVAVHTGHVCYVPQTPSSPREEVGPPD